jgi:O-antigen ligase
MYAVSLNSFLASPLTGGIFNPDIQLGMHSELLDLLAGLGIFGTLVFLAGIWLIGRGMAKGIAKSDALPHLILQWITFAVFAALNTVFYSREIPLVLCLCIAFAVWTGREKSGIINNT